MLYRFSPIKRDITNDQRFMDLLLISSVFKNLYLPKLFYSFSPVQFFGTPPPPPPPPLPLAISGFLALTSLLHWIITSHKIFTSSFLHFQQTFWSMLISFSTSFLVVFIRQFPMNYSCNIIVPSLILLLCQLFTFTCNMRYCFSFLVTHSKKW